MSGWDDKDSEYVGTYGDFEETLQKWLVGRTVVSANPDDGEIILDNGKVLTFDKDASDCCSYATLTALNPINNIIVKVQIEDDSEAPDRGYCDDYKCYIRVVTTAGLEVLAESYTNPGNEGYYLTGWSLGVTIPKTAAVDQFWEEFNS